MNIIGPLIRTLDDLYHEGLIWQRPGPGKLPAKDKRKSSKSKKPRAGKGRGRKG